MLEDKTNDELLLEIGNAITELREAVENPRVPTQFEKDSERMTWICAFQFGIAMAEGVFGQQIDEVALKHLMRDVSEGKRDVGNHDVLASDQQIAKLILRFHKEEKNKYRESLAIRIRLNGRESVDEAILKKWNL